jgi:diguanylate cyclase (GGDEF)-like protein
LVARWVHVFTAQLIDAEADSESILRDALADAGCIDIEDGSCSFSSLRDVDASHPSVFVVCVHGANFARLHRVASAVGEVPILVVCDEQDIDAAFAAGASQCATRPLRRRELVGRIREALRTGTVERRHAHRERKMSDAIVSLKREKQDLERLVCVDTLTGIANRRHAMELLSAEWKRAARDHRPVALVMIDLDCFHSYNEHYGHPGGDACLQQVADAMVRCLRRPSDYLGRYGGEEFMAVLPNTDAVGAKIVAERLRAAVEALALPHAASTCAPVVTITAGFAAIKVLSDDDPDRLIAAADAALLQAKRIGRNRVGGIAPLVRPSRVSAQRWHRYAPVYVDPWFADRMPTLLRTIEHEVRSLIDTVRAGERRSGLGLQRLRESVREAGLDAVAMLIGELEHGVREGDISSLRDRADELLQYVAHVQIIYRRIVDTQRSTTVVQTA